MKKLKDIANFRALSNPENESAVVQTLFNILNIEYKSLIFNRGIGSEIEKILFEPFTISTMQRLRHIIVRDIKYQCPLARIISFNIEMDYDNRAYNVSINLDIEGIGKSIFNTTLKSKDSK